MGMMKRFLFFFLLVLSGVHPVLSCSCDAPDTKKLFEGSDWVFYGEVEKIKPLEPTMPGKETKVEVSWKILNEWKRPSKTPVMRTTLNKYSCRGLLGDEGDRILMFSRCKNGICGSELCAHFGLSEDIVQRSNEIDEVIAAKKRGGPKK